MIDFLKFITIDLPMWAMFIWVFGQGVEILLLKRKIEKLEAR